MTTFTSYGEVQPQRQSEIIRNFKASEKPLSDVGLKTELLELLARVN